MDQSVALYVSYLILNQSFLVSNTHLLTTVTILGKLYKLCKPQFFHFLIYKLEECLSQSMVEKILNYV